MSTPSKQKRGLSFVGCQIPPSTHETRATAEAWDKKRHFYKRLPKEFRRDGFNYRQIAREGDVAVYEQTWLNRAEPSRSYEVIRVRRRDGFQIGGRFIEPAEVYPASELWGVNGFTFADRNKAFDKFFEISLEEPARRGRQVKNGKIA